MNIIIIWDASQPCNELFLKSSCTLRFFALSQLWDPCAPSCLATQTVTSCHLVAILFHTFQVISYCYLLLQHFLSYTKNLGQSSPRNNKSIWPHLQRYAPAHAATWLFELPVTAKRHADWRRMAMLAAFSRGFAASCSCCTPLQRGQAPRHPRAYTCKMIDDFTPTIRMNQKNGTKMEQWKNGGWCENAVTR